MRGRPLLLIATLSVTGALVAGWPANAAAAPAAEGKWVGDFTSAAGTKCKKPRYFFSATVKDGRAIFTFGPGGHSTDLETEIGADGAVDVTEILKNNGKPLNIEGRFSGTEFDGTFAVGAGACYGVATARLRSAQLQGQLASGRAAEPAVSASRAAEEATYWQSIQHSNSLAEFMAYLEKYPNGIFVKLAEAQMRDLVNRQQDVSTAAVTSGSAGAAAGAAGDNPLAGIDLGSYYAIVIGIDNYRHLPDLATAIADAKAVAKLLEDEYGFIVRLLIDPDRGQIIDAFDDFMATLSSKDNLLIYYAGHGWLDEATDRGYWLPVDAKEGRRSNWLSNATVTDTLKSLAAKHVMVVADSCYSGTLTRAAVVALRNKNYLRRMARKHARVAMVSGGLEPVADSDGDGHSPFARAFLSALRGNTGVMDGTKLFSEIRRPVILGTQQTPEYSDVRNAGHDGGDFLFVRQH